MFVWIYGLFIVLVGLVFVLEPFEKRYPEWRRISPQHMRSIRWASASLVAGFVILLATMHNFSLVYAVIVGLLFGLGAGKWGVTFAQHSYRLVNDRRREAANQRYRM
jgi:hypothetical protein